MPENKKFIKIQEISLKFLEIQLTLFKISYIFFVTVARDGDTTKVEKLFDRYREGKKTNLKYVSKMNRLSSSIDLKINSRLMDWDRKLYGKSLGFGLKNKSWRV